MLDCHVRPAITASDIAATRTEQMVGIGSPADVTLGGSSLRTDSGIAKVGPSRVIPFPPPPARQLCPRGTRLPTTGILAAGPAERTPSSQRQCPRRQSRA